MNKVILRGRLGADPEVRTSESGAVWCTFSLATDEFVNNEKQTAWHRVKAFGKEAENIGKYKRKGDELLLEGRIQYGEYEDKDGVTKYTTDIIVQRSEFIGGRRGADTDEGGGGERKPAPRQQSRGSTGNRYAQPESDATPADDDIPFN